MTGSAGARPVGRGRFSAWMASSFALHDVHVAHGRREVLVAGEILDDGRRLAGHRQVRTEGVAKEVDVPRRLQPGLSPGSLHE